MGLNSSFQTQQLMFYCRVKYKVTNARLFVLEAVLNSVRTEIYINLLYL